MRVAVDRRLAGGEGTGVASYARAVEAALETQRIAVAGLEDATTGRFGGARGRPEQVGRWLAAWAPHARPLAERHGGATLWRRDLFRLAQVRFRLTGRVLRLRAPGPPGIMHWTYPIPAVVDGWINVHTVHDVIPLEHPDLSPIDPDALRGQLRAIAAVTDRIVTVSEAARRAILSAMAFPADAVVDCGGAVVDLDREPGPLPQGLVARGYLLCCGVVERRKNLDRLVEAWTLAGRPMPLVIAGPDGADGAALRARLAVQGALMLPFQPRPVLMQLIADARALVFPSLVEGFGLPVAEAMALGTPVVTADRGALAETAGGAASAVDTTDTAAWARAIARIVRDDAFAAALAVAGRRRARDFAPDALGRRLAALYDGLVAERATLD